MQQGTIKNLNSRGFGFIVRDGQDKDLFFHSSALVGVTFDDLREGDKVTFEEVQGDKGPAATNVSRVVEGAPAEVQGETA